MVNLLLDKVSTQEIEQVFERQKQVIAKTPLQFNEFLSQKYECNIYLKREDLNYIRSYKNRGAYNLISSLNETQRNKGIVCSSAGNHAMGVAFSCAKLNIAGKIYMPVTTPKQKINQVKLFGKDKIEIVLTGDTYDDAYKEAMNYCKQNNKTFIHPFNDYKVIAGQGTVGFEIMQDADFQIDTIVVPIGGGGISAGIGSYVKQKSPKTQLIGIEPSGAPAMKKSIEQNEILFLEKIDKFVDGAAVQSVGEKTFNIVKNVVDEIELVDEGKICTTILKMYNELAIVVEPAGAMSIAALDQLKDKIKGKNVVCVVTGGNNDILRTEEIKERSLVYEGLKHYFIVRFPQRAGALKQFVSEILGPNDSISRFEYTKKNNRETGPALIGIELQNKADYIPLIKRMEAANFNYQALKDNQDLYNLLV